MADLSRARYSAETDDSNDCDGDDYNNGDGDDSNDGDGDFEVPTASGCQLKLERFANDTEESPQSTSTSTCCYCSVSQCLAKVFSESKILNAPILNLFVLVLLCSFSV